MRTSSDPNCTGLKSRVRLSARPEIMAVGKFPAFRYASVCWLICAAVFSNALWHAASKSSVCSRFEIMTRARPAYSGLTVTRCIRAHPRERSAEGTGAPSVMRGPSISTVETSSITPFSTSGGSRLVFSSSSRRASSMRLSLENSPASGMATMRASRPSGNFFGSSPFLLK